MMSKKFRHEDQVRDDLLKSMSALFSDSEMSSLLTRLRSNFPLISFALIVNWIPEQGEDIYWILIDESRIAVIEVPRRTNIDVGDMPIEILSVS